MNARKAYYLNAINKAAKLYDDVVGDPRVEVANHVQAGAVILSMLQTWDGLAQERFDVIDAWARSVIDVENVGLTDSDLYEIAGKVACCVKFLVEAPKSQYSAIEAAAYHVEDDVIMAAVKEQQEEREA